jgi:hypothetical protein
VDVGISGATDREYFATSFFISLALFTSQSYSVSPFFSFVVVFCFVHSWPLKRNLSSKSVEGAVKLHDLGVGLDLLGLEVEDPELLEGRGAA